SKTWNEYFSKHRPRPGEIRKLVLKLHDDKQHEHVIAAIEAAIINGQAQPWMYDVLALSMEIAGRPKKDIERVLLSRVDVTGTDVPSMLVSAAYLTRFGGQSQALRMYRQASRIAPTRPEPYVLGLKLAETQNDFDAIKWAATGILTSAWTRNHQQLHRQAENSAAEAIQKLEKLNRADEAALFRTAMQEARKRDLVLKLTWNGIGDLDLIVDEPPGTTCSCKNPLSPGGGVLVHDGFGPNQKNCYEEYVCARGVPGKYRVRIRHVWGNIVGKRAKLTVIRYQGSENESVRSFTVPLAEHDRIVRLSLPNGRRKELVPIEDRTISRLFENRSRPAGILRQIGNPGPGGQIAAQSFANSRRFAGGVGFRPVISNIMEGVSLNAAAVVSGDRRYVRIAVTPVFSAITDVFTFSFVNSGGNPTGNPGVGGNGFDGVP
ncbi:MAG: hypothetical protein IH899_20700, partial [Planctomycetes bacterium]|nr:hypothetical protein [Planctomycetota bacterium]